MIKNVIFDLGVVLLDVNYQRTIDAFTALGMDNPVESFSKHKQDDFFRKYERGHMTENEFLKGLSKRTGVADLYKLRDAWCEMLGGFPKEKYDFIKKFGEDFSLFILSNTNQTHQIWFEKKIDEQYGWKNFTNCFVHIGYSHQINQRKPDKEAFQYLLDTYDLNPRETLFVDDTLDHVHGARKLGLQALHYKDDQDLRDLVVSQIERDFTSF